MEDAGSTCLGKPENRPCDEVLIAVKETVEVDKFQLQIDNQMQLVAEVIIDVDLSAIQSELAKVTSGLSDLPSDVRLKIVDDFRERVQELLIDGKLYSRPETVSTNRACHRVIFIPTREFTELVAAFLVRAREWKNAG